MFRSVRGGWLIAVALPVTVIAGCGDDADKPIDAAVVDAAVDVDARAEAPEPDAPATPAGPMWTPCPEGWTEVPPWRSGAATTCEPWPAARLEDCAGRSAWIPGEPGCAPIGGACTGDGWPAGLPDGAIYVRPLATGGDGSRDAPFATVAEALSAAAPGAVIALAEGEHELAVTLAAAVTLRGACVGGTTLFAPGPDATTVTVTAPGARIEDVTIAGPGEGVRVTAGDVTLRRILVDGASFGGVVVTAGAAVDADRVVIRAMQPHPVRGQGIAIAVLSGRGSFSHTVVEGSQPVGVLLDAADFTMTDSSVGDVEASADGLGGPAIAAGGASTLSLARVVAERGRTVGVALRGSGTHGVVEDVLIRDTRVELASGDYGIGLAVFDGASAEIRRTAVLRSSSAGVSVFSNAGLSSVVAEDLVVHDVASDGSPEARGYGLGVLQEASFEGTRVLVDGVETTGLAVYQAEARLTDLVLRDVRPSARDPIHGLCTAVELDARLTLERALFEDCHEVGLQVAEGATFDATDLTVRRVLSRVTDGTFGRGLNVQEASVTLSRAWFEDCREVSVLAFGTTSVVSATDLTVADTHERDCVAAPAGCPEGPSVTLGMGVVAIGGASIALSRFAVTGSDLCGLQVGSDATMDLSDGLVARNAIGLNLQNRTLDIARLEDGVVYRDNGVNLDATALPTPSPR